MKAKNARGGRGRRGPADLAAGMVTGQVDIVVGGEPEHQVRFVVGQTVCVESMVGDRWSVRYWGLDGRVDPSAFWDSDAFELRMATSPSVDVPATVLSAGWRWLSASELPKTHRGARHFQVGVSNAVLPIAVKVHTLLDGTPVLMRWLEITNQGDAPLALMGVVPWSGRLWSKTGALHLGHSLHREVGWEGWFGWTPLPVGATVIRNDTDRLWDDPYFMLRDEAGGDCFFGQLAWQANYQMEFQRDDGLAFKIEPIALKALLVIGKGETIRTPAVHLGGVKGGFDATVQAMHDHVRRSVVPARNPDRAYRSQYIVPGDWGVCHYHGEAFNEQNLAKCIDVAAAAGLDVFILDGPTWVSTYGDWLVPHPDRFPHGLSPLIERTREKGMLFGLYFEPEGGRDADHQPVSDVWPRVGFWRESKIYRAHPEWFIRTNLDLTIPAAAEYLEAELGRIIEHYHLDLYRHDANGIYHDPPGPGSGQAFPGRRGGFFESNYWRHHEALNGVFQRIAARYPDVILQQASAGGYRLDLATAGSFHEHFASDAGGQLHSFRRLAGLSVFLPPEIVVNAFGLCNPKDLPELDTSLRGAYALGFTPMFFTSLLPASVEDFKPDVRERYLHHAAVYRERIRPLLATCRVYHHAPVNATDGVEAGDWLAMEFMSPDRRKGWATIIHLQRTAKSYLLKPKGLDPRREYMVTFDNTGRTEPFKASNLMRDGLEISTTADRCSELLLFNGNVEEKM